MLLHGYYRSSTSYRVRIALNLIGLHYTSRSVDLKTGEHFEPVFEAINPHKSVPVLDVDGRQFSQSLAIMDWLEAAYPTPSLLPEDASHVQLCLELYYAIVTEVHAPNNLAVLTYLKNMFDADQDSLAHWNRTWMERTFEPVHRRLCEHGWSQSGLPFGAPGLFEIVLIHQIYNARRWDLDLSPFPRLLEIDALCAELDPFKKACPDYQPDAPES